MNGQSHARLLIIRRTAHSARPRAYRDQGFDISGNPGLTATLYNVGQPRRRARALRESADKPGGRKLPEENYYGWLINDRLPELRGLLDAR